MKDFIKTCLDQFDSLSVNYKLIVVNAVVSFFGLACGITRLISAYNLTWFEKFFFSPENMAQQINMSWAMIILSAFAGVCAVILHLREKRRYKKIQEKLKSAIRSINEEDAVDAEIL